MIGGVTSRLDRVPLTDRPSLVEAIRLRRLVRFRYESASAQEVRLVAPHCLYLRDGDCWLDGVQMEGASRSGDLPAWRSFAVESIADVSIQAVSFAPSPEYAPQSVRYAHAVALT